MNTLQNNIVFTVMFVCHHSPSYHRGRDAFSSESVPPKDGEKCILVFTTWLPKTQSSQIPWVTSFANISISHSKLNLEDSLFESLVKTVHPHVQAAHYRLSGNFYLISPFTNSWDKNKADTCTFICWMTQVLFSPTHLWEQLGRTEIARGKALHQHREPKNTG